MIKPASNPTAAIRPQKTKVSIIREEYVSITGRFEQALILNQFVYWSERVRDFDDFILEENQRKDKCDLQEEMEEPTHGWIYKSAQQLSEELMTGWSPATIGRHLKPLIDIGFLEVRQNPKYMWNQTKQFRVDLNAIGQALYAKGYSIPGYSLIQFSGEDSPIFKMKNQKIDLKNVPYTETINKDDERKVPQISQQPPPDQLPTVPPPLSSIPDSKTTTPPPAPTPPVNFQSPLAFFPPAQPPTPGIETAGTDDIKTALAALVLLIPEDMRKPSTVARLAKAIADGVAIATIKEAILFTNDRSDRKTWMRYRGHLGNCIDKGWSEGYQGQDIDENKIIRERLKLPVALLEIEAGKGDRYAIKALGIIQNE